MRGLIFAALTAAFVGCAQVGGVSEMESDTYRVTSIAAPVRGGSSGAQTLSLEKAGKYCADIDKEAFVINVSHREINAAGAGSSEVTFRCLDSNDRDLYLNS